MGERGALQSNYPSAALASQWPERKGVTTIPINIGKIQRKPSPGADVREINAVQSLMLLKVSY